MLGIGPDFLAELSLNREGMIRLGLNHLSGGFLVDLYKLRRGFLSIIRRIGNREFFGAKITPARRPLVVDCGGSGPFYRIGHECCLHRQLNATAANCQWYESTKILDTTLVLGYYEVGIHAL